MKRLTRNLLNNSIEAFVLALETINRPSVRYRTEAFCFLFCNSWELLMKAKIFSDGHKIFYPKRRKQPRKSFSLDDCLNRVFTSENDPVKLNILKISELRNNAIHLVIPFVPPDIMGLFQAGVLNYPKALQDWFGISLSARIPLGMMTLVYDFDPKEHSLDYPKMRRRLSADTFRWLSGFQQDIRNQAASLGDVVRQFYIPIDLKLAIVRNPDDTHPHCRKEVVELVNRRLGGKLTINGYDIQCIRKVYGIDSRDEFHYKGKYSLRQYSDKFIEWIISQARSNPDFFEQTRSKAKAKKQSA